MTRRRALQAGVVALLLLPLTILVRLGGNPLTDADRRADDNAHALVTDHSGLLSLVRGLTHLGDPVVVTAAAVLAAVVCWLTRRRRDAVYLVAVRVVAVILGFGLKEAVGRARPVLEQPVAHAGGYSFPSGHALGAAVLYGSLAVVTSGAVRRRSVRWTLFAVAAALSLVVAATRVLLGVHFPSDVVAGLVLGWGIVLIGRSVEPRPAPGDASATRPVAA